MKFVLNMVTLEIFFFVFKMGLKLICWALDGYGGFRSEKERFSSEFCFLNNKRFFRTKFWIRLMKVQKWFHL